MIGLVRPGTATTADGQPASDVEDHLLLVLARVELTPAVEDRARRLLEEPVSWPRLVTRAREHGLLPLLDHHLARLGFPGTPAAARRELGAAYRDTAILNGLHARELSRVLDALGEAGIRVIPLKGVALAESLYRDTGLRVCSDIDLLVPEPDVRRAVDVLREAGYRAEFGEQFLLDVLRRHDIELALLRRKGSMTYALDLHWGLAWPGARERAGLEALWGAARRTTFRGAPAWGMTREWELLFLALHASRHRWRLLKWLVDIDALCARGGIDWAVVLDTARRFGWEAPLRVSLAACETLLGTPLPDGLRGGRVPAWVRLFPEDVPDDAAQDVLVPLRLRERSAERLRQLARVLLVPTVAERRLVRLPAAAHLLYYPLRPLRLAGKWGARLLAASMGRR